MLITASLLQRAMGCTAERAARFAPHFAEVCAHYGITSPARLAAFIAQVGHESMSLRHVREVWGPTPAQRRYEGRKDLGNIHPGDGERFLGRGVLQTTGRHNYRALRDRLAPMGCPDFEATPGALEEPRWAVWSAGDYWDMRRLNALADAGDFLAITLKVNGGTNGYEDRKVRWAKAKAALAVDTDEEKDVPPFIAAALPHVISAAPALIDMFKGDSKSAERNAELGKVVVGIAKEALQAPNEQALVERLETDPQARDVVKQAIEVNWFEIQKAHDAALREARTFAVDYARVKDVRIVAFNLTFLEILTFFLVAVGTLGGLGALFWGDLSESMEGLIIGVLLVESVVGVRKFWFGNVGSTNDTERRKEVA